MRPAWWVVFTRELRDLWIGGKGPYLILLYTLLLGGYSFTLASSVEVKMMLVSEMILEMVKASAPALARDAPADRVRQAAGRVFALAHRPRDLDPLLAGARQE